MIVTFFNTWSPNIYATTIIEAQDGLLNLEKWNKSKFQNSICPSSFDSKQ